MTGVRLRQLTFTGTDIKPARLEFQNHINIIYGASNTGKSFTAKAILFMLGVGKALPETEEITSYSEVWLGMTLPDGRDITLYRSTQGGDLKLYEGLSTGIDLGTAKILRHKHDSKQANNISRMLLSEMGLDNRQIVRDANGKKSSLTINKIAPYIVVSEEDIIAERTPVHISGSPSERTFEENLLRLLITGEDGSNIVTTPKPTERKVAKAAKIEMVDELITQIDDELGEPPPAEQDAKDQLERLNHSIQNLSADLQETQKELDAHVSQRREEADNLGKLKEKAYELEITLHRFADLESVYKSDLERLQSIEEGGYVLIAFADKECPVCGAPPGTQTHNHAAEEISQIHVAAAAESHKIVRENSELAQTIISLEGDSKGLQDAIQECSNKIKTLDSAIHEMRPNEASLREKYEAFNAKRMEVMKIIDLYNRRERLVSRRAEISAEPTKNRKEDALSVGPDSSSLFKFGATLRSVLEAWSFPNAHSVQFDSNSYDITVAGKRRSANGKGVRAILHAAYNVAVIVYCIQNKLPHPGFLILDTPLLTYREPMTSRHGDLSEDEAELKSTNLAEHFYQHLDSLKNHVQFIVIENSDPPEAIQSLANIQAFTGLKGNGRFGLL